MTPRVDRGRDEDGAVLVVALVVMLFFSVVVAAVLSFADTGLRTSMKIEEQRSELYAADAAVEAAIRYYQVHGTCVSPGLLPAANGVSGVQVTCDGDPAQTAPPANQPSRAVVAVAQGGEVGFEVNSGGITRVRGGVYSNTAVRVSAGTSLEVAGPVEARAGCDTDRITATGGENCAFTGADPAPSYSHALTDAPAEAVLPSCAGTGPVVFQPGTYSSLTALHAVMANPLCKNRILHFPPGVYYFDFLDGGSAPQWKIDNGAVVVGGMLTWDGTFASRPAAGERCDKEGAGVQWVFGGTSSFRVNTGAADLCATESPDGIVPEIAVFGLTAGDVPLPPASVTTPIVPDPLLTPATPAVAGNGAFANPDHAEVAETPRQVASAAINSTNSSRQSSIRLSGFNTAAIPPGAAITNVTLRVLHRETTTTEPTLNQLNLLASVAGSGAAVDVQTASCGNTPNCLSGLAKVSTFPAPTDLSQNADITSVFNTREKLQNLSVTYTGSTASSNNARTFTSELDAVQVLVTYTTAPPPAGPQLRRQSGCIVNGVCEFISTSGTGSNLAVHGTVYAPLAELDVNLVGVSYSVFGRGVVARRIRAHVTSSSPCGAANPAYLPASCYPFQLEGAVPGDVLFVGTVGGRVLVRALVRFDEHGVPDVTRWSAGNATS